MKVLPQQGNVLPPETASRSAKAAAVAREFESIFAGYMLKAMRSTVGDNEFVPTSLGEKMYTDMLDQEYSGLMAGNAGFGLAKLIMQQLGEDPDALDSLGSVRGLQLQPWMLDNRLVPNGSNNQASDFLQSNLSTWDPHIADAGSMYDLDPNLLKAIIARESGGNPYAVSRAGAKGLMQLMDSTAHEVGVVNAFNPEQNIRGGSRYLRQLLDRFNGDETLALASYNAGPAAVERYGGVPPYIETQDYVKNVLAMRQAFAHAAENPNKEPDDGSAAE